jgi:chromosome partitioning protein
VPNLSLVPSTMDLLGLEMVISGDADRAFKLKHAVKDAGAILSDGQPLSYILIDCPPSLNLLTINALVAADAVLVPLQCEFFALEGLSQLLSTIEQIKQTLNPALYVQGLVMTMYDPRNNLSDQVLADVKAHMGELVYESVIPRNVRLSEAPSYGKPALLYDLKCAGSQAYLKLATEVIRRERHLRAA